MKTSYIASFFAVIGLVAASSQAFASAKVAEFGDSQLGNTYRNCAWNPTYSTGGEGYEYREYNVVCPASNGIPDVNIKAGISFTYSNSYSWYTQTTCQMYVPSGYSTGGDCNNWRIYSN